MDPTFAPILFIGFLVAIGLMSVELRDAADPPVCPQCSHCRQVADDKRRREAELREWYAQRWRLGERDDDDRRNLR